MATKERTQLGFFQQKELEALLMEIATNNSVGKGQTLPTSHLSAGSAFRDREERRRAYTHTHNTHTYTIAQKYPSHHQPRCFLAWNSCSWRHLSGSLSGSERSVSRGSHQEPDIQEGNRCQREASGEVAVTDVAL